MVRDVTQASRLCPNCGTKRPVNATRCPKCGAPVKSAASDAADAFFDADPFQAPPSRLRTLLDHMVHRIQQASGLGALRRLVALVALVIVLIAAAYAVLPFKTGTARLNCGPAVVEVFDRKRVPPAPAPAVVTPTKDVLKPCTHQAQRRLGYAVPIIVLTLIGSIVAQRILS